MRASILGLAAFAGVIAGGACTPLAFECISDENCISSDVQGVCQASGFCSYPDPECETQQRYDEFAGDGLADQCVQGCAVPDCIDRDGDGYGVGADCAGPDCDDDNPAHSDRCVYVVPGGDDAAAGTIDAPWGTLAAGVAVLEPGMTLVLLDGVYEPSTTGLLSVSCGEGGNARNGTAEQPIGVRAANERAAELLGGGTGPAIQVSGCGFWGFHGLRATGGDLRGSEGGIQSSLVSISASHDLVVRRLLAAYNNRIFNSELFSVQGSTDVLVEEAEGYFFHRAAFLVYESERVTLRRCYAHSRDWPDLPDCNGEVDPEAPFCSSPADGGDAAFTIYRAGTDIAFENCIVEGRTGFGVDVGNASVRTAVRGSIVLDRADYGVFVASSSAGEASVVGTTIEDTLVVAPQNVGVYLRSTTDVRARGLTILRSAGSGFHADQNSEPLCADIPGGCSFAAERVLAQGNTDSGFGVAAEVAWTLDSCNAFGNGTDYPSDEDIADAEGNIRGSLSVDSGIGGAGGGCFVYVPADSPMSGAAADGNDIGATILWRIEGTATDVPLWDPQTGAFPCGAIVPGINDDPGSSCIGVHTRLNVFGNGCETPPDYVVPSACE